MNYQARREAKVKALNRANEVANALYYRFAAIFAPLVGHKVVNGSSNTFPLLIDKQVREVVKEAERANLQVIFTFNRYSVVYTVKAWENGDGVTYYQEPFQYLLDLDAGNILKRVYDNEPKRTDWTVEEVESLRKELATLEGRVTTLKGKLEPFARFDS